RVQAKLQSSTKLECIFLNGYLLTITVIIIIIIIIVIIINFFFCHSSEKIVNYDPLNTYNIIGTVDKQKKIIV
ncbi:MAG: hypothetical protein N7Q72_06710, partial [Spiroplasma sp. Tabriz.8]|nr:hypothetical protein [Candidatus Regiella insecticola]MCZ8632936.1 hypothetical protein [Spiroplasma sp. Tabriz.8]